MKKSLSIRVRGIVQGVGFRPYIYRLAHSMNLTGYVRNTTDGVDIEIEGDARACDTFLQRLEISKPQAAHIYSVNTVEHPTKGYKVFAIKKSKKRHGFTQISPDIATCSECVDELYDEEDRRFRYPFINCTNCGPRYSIIRTTPYDRAMTSMRSFEMCSQCAAEFHDVMDRRFHAQPDCCRTCGPRLAFYTIQGTCMHGDSIAHALRLLSQGEIIAVKGIGGYHIACDATDNAVVKRLRAHKYRPAKPFAIMVSPAHVARVARMSQEEQAVLESPAAPIVLLKKKGKIIAEAVAPNNPYLGIMFPYAPLHYLLLEHMPYLVMTSANIQDEPVIHDESTLKEKLGDIVTHYLAHDRVIENRCDDSVGFHTPGKGFSILRRSRGYVPTPIDLPMKVRPTLAVGPFLKNTFTCAHQREAYVSPHIGDLDNIETLSFFREMVEKYKRWFKIDPALIVHDLHPDYLSTKLAQDYAEKLEAQLVGVQHHCAHMVSCLAEHSIQRKAIGIIFDGTGFGTDGKIWGGEFFVGDLIQQQRVGHLLYLPLPGGEASIKKPYRIAIAYAYKLLNKKLGLKGVSSIERDAVISLVDLDQSLVYTSSMGRLFDCVAGLLGLIKEITYEAEAAITLEYCASSNIQTCYPYDIEESDVFTINVSRMLRAIMEDMRKKVDQGTIAARFHNTVIECALDVAAKLRTIYSIDDVCLSGGVFQNRYLYGRLVDRLEQARFKVHVHNTLPTNDGCISYGQVVAGNALASGIGSE